MHVVCPYCRSLYNPASNAWNIVQLPRLYIENHYLHMCNNCATKKGMKYYEV
jgi:hypothetical protein